MAIARRSWLVAAATAAVGFALYFYDDVFEGLDLADTAAHRIATVVELLLMGPGMGLLGLSLSEMAAGRERDLRREREHAEMQRWQALGRVAASVAHEVRNPLHNIALIVDELRPDRAGPLWERLGANLARIDRAVDLVYELARPSPRDPVEDACDLAPLVAEAIAGVRAHWPALTVAGEGPAALPALCRSAPARIILDNLLRNAASAALEADGRVAWGVHREAGTWVVRVANRGRLSVPADDPRFASSKPDGLGLGVAISRQLAANAGGSLALAQEGDEVVATLRLPAAREDA